jgi:hypothetical protein
MVFVLGRGALGWRQLASPGGPLPWPLVAVLTVIVVFAACVALGSLLARTPLSVALTGRSRERWRSLVPRGRHHRALRPPTAAPGTEPAVPVAWGEQAA